MWAPYARCMIDRSLAAVLVVVALVVGPSCLHDWDAYEAPEDGTGQGGSSSSGGNTSAICSSTCTVYADCIANDWSNCPADCTAKVANCSNQALENLQSCIAEVQADCDTPWAAQTGWITCTTTDVPCLYD